MTTEAAKKCESFDCQEPGTIMASIGPGTSVWLCEACRQELEDEEGDALALA